MKPVRFRSLQLRLAVPLAALYIAATAIAVGVLIYQAYDTASSLNDRELVLRAEDLARSVTKNDAGALELKLSTRHAALYAASTDDIFAIRDASGWLVAASPTEFGDRVSKWPLAKDDPSYFRLSNLGSTDYYGLSIELASPAGPVSVSVARATDANAIVRSLLREFVFDAAWVSPLLMAATLGIGILVIRRGFRPVMEISRMAAAIGPNAPSVRLPRENLPAELEPLVDAVNLAFDRLEDGFAVQRQFTANAAHELRTPLAIVTGTLDTMEGNGELIKLKDDVARMNRLVEQLLRVARLDAVALELGTVDLNEVASSAVVMMAPWAIARDRTVAFVGAESPVYVSANAPAVADAIRNLIENGILHSPPMGEVVVTVHSGGYVSVADTGAGVPLSDRERIFDRFWRGGGPKAQGAGLGLAIVQEIMKAHSGGVTVSDNSVVGALFTLNFPMAEEQQPTKA